MWPWGHLAFGYLLYSLARRILPSGRIEGREVVVLAVATQLPDLIDKPLAWTLSVFPSGYSVAHSVFVAVPLALALFAVAIKHDRFGIGLAVVVGWWSHLFGDVLVAVLMDGTFTVTRVLWPLVVLPGSHTSLSSLEQFTYYLGEFLELLSTAESPLIFLLYFGPLAVAGLLWLLDGAPVVRELHDWASGPS